MNATLEQVWDDLAGDLRRFLRRRVGDEHAVEDLLQDVFLKATRHLQQDADPAQLPAWLFRVARNAVIDHYRARHGVQELDETTAEQRAAADEQEQDCLQLSFRRFVHALPPPYREALLLTEQEGLSQVALAQRLGIPVSTAKSRVQRGRNRLRQALLDCCRFEFDRRGKVIDWQRRQPGDCGEC